MDRLEAMAMLVSSVEEGSLSAAARKLRIPVATLTRNVNDLESTVGTKLLVRHLGDARLGADLVLVATGRPAHPESGEVASPILKATPPGRAVTMAQPSGSVLPLIDTRARAGP